MKATIPILFMTLMLSAPALGAQQAAADPYSSIGVGAFGNVGYGTEEFTSVPGATLRYGDFPVDVHLTKSGDAWESGATADWMALKGHIGATRFAWYLGPGIYAAAGSDFSDFSCVGIGLRAVAGARTVVLDSWEAFAQLSPSVGTTAQDGDWKGHWSMDLEIGVRYLIRGSESAAARAK